MATEGVDKKQQKVSKLRKVNGARTRIHIGRGKKWVIGGRFGRRTERRNGPQQGKMPSPLRQKKKRGRERDLKGIGKGGKEEGAERNPDATAGKEEGSITPGCT